MRIGIDVDEVVCDMHRAWARVYNFVAGQRGYPNRIRPEQITHNPEDFANGRWPGLFEPYVLGSHLYKEDMVRVMPFAVEALDALRRMGHQITFVTVCGPANHMASAKFDWLVRAGLLVSGDLYMPFARDSGANKGPTKSTAPVDVLLDDSPHHVRNFMGLGVLMLRPHNWHDRHPICHKVRTLREFVELIRRRYASSRMW